MSIKRYYTAGLREDRKVDFSQNEIESRFLYLSIKRRIATAGGEAPWVKFVSESSSNPWRYSN